MMYRQRTVETETSNEKFVSRLYELPVVSSAVGRLGALYTGTKEHNRLFRFTLETAESGLVLAVNTARPVVAKFEKPIGALNGMACQQLEKLEHDYPIITKPTDVVLKQTYESCQSAVQPITDRIKPITERVGSAKQYGITKINDVKVYTVDTIGGMKSYSVNKVNDVKTYGVDKVNGVKTYSMDKLTMVTDLGSKQVARILENETGRAFIAKLDLAIDVTDSYVDKYLPEEGESVVEKTVPSQIKKMEVDEASQQGVVMTKAMQLGYKVRRRAYNHMAKRLKVMKMRSLETVDKLHFTVDLMEYARNNIDGVKSKAHYVWDEINKSPEEVAKETSGQECSASSLTYERRAIATARHLTRKLKTGLSGFNLSVEMIPAPVRTQVQGAIDLAQSLFQMFTSRAKTGVTEDDMNKVKNSLGQLRTTLGSVSGWNSSAAFVPTLKKMIPFKAMSGAANDQLRTDQSDLSDGSEGHHD